MKPSSFRLYEGAAFLGFACFVAVPIVVLVSGGPPLLAGTLGYFFIAVFVGGIAARYGFIERNSPALQLLLNTLLAMVFSGVFYLIFLLILLV
jgi:hypothetical protein